MQLKDKRYKLTEKDIQDIIKYYHGYNDDEGINQSGTTLTKLARDYHISHQRISQILDLNNTLHSHRQKDISKRKLRYNTDSTYRQTYLENKRLYYATK